MRKRGVEVLLGLVFATMMLVVGCKPSVPSEFISEDDMEDILYDYHMADAMAHQSGGDDGANVIAYRAAILKKYGVTEAEFDTSMVYYMRHTDRLHTMYEHIAERLENKARDLGSSEGTLASLSKTRVAGDTVDVWKGEKALALIPNAPYNVYSFSVTPDSSYHKGDTFILAFNSSFIFQDGMRDGIAAMAIVFKNDSITSRIMHLSSSNRVNITLEDGGALGIKEIRGYFFLNKNQDANSSSSTLHLMTISNIHLFRCRNSKSQSTQPNAAGQTPGDSAKRNPQRIPVSGAPPSNIDSMKEPTPPPPVPVR